MSEEEVTKSFFQKHGNKNKPGSTSEHVYYLFTYDRKEHEEKDLKPILEKLITDKDKINGSLTVCPEESTIIFKTSKDFNRTLFLFLESELNDIHFTLYPLGKNMKSGHMNKPKEIVDPNSFEKDYKNK